MKKLQYFILIGAIVAPVIVSVGSAFGITKIDLLSIYNGTEYYEGSTTCTGSSASTSNVTDAARASFQAYQAGIYALQDAYKKAVEDEPIPWQILAAIHYREARNSPEHSIFSGEPIGQVNPDRPIVLGTTLEENLELGVDFLYTKMATGYPNEIDPDDGFTQDELAKTFISWNRGAAYRLGAPERPEYGSANLSPYFSPYVAAGLDQDHPLNMRYPTDGNEPPSMRGVESGGIGALVIYKLLSGPESGLPTSADGACSGQFGISANGFVFPTLTTKSYLRGPEYNRSLTPIPCRAEGGWACHHDYFAADIGGIAGETVVVASVGGVVTNFGRNSIKDVAYCNADPDDKFTVGPGGVVRIYVNGVGAPKFASYVKFRVPGLTIQDDEGITYFYTHMQPGELYVGVGDRVEAGQPIGKVGPSACAQGTSPHVHAHMSPPSSSYNYGGVFHSAKFGDLVVHNFGDSYQFGGDNKIRNVDLINLAYEGLPE